MVADETGSFGLCYLMEGSYSARLTDEHGVTLINEAKVTIHSPLNLGAVHGFQTLDELRFDNLMSYASKRPALEIESGGADE